jgi:hypothetical protein
MGVQGRGEVRTSYFAESVSTFAIVMGIALLLSGSGFLVLTLRVLRRADTATARSSRVAVAAG